MNLEKVISVHPDEWLTLSSQVRSMVTRLQEKALGTPLEADVTELAHQIPRLCDHLVRTDREAGDLSIGLDENLPKTTTVSPCTDLNEVQREALQIHQETHELRADFKDIIKALFMWQDDPSERVMKKAEN